MNIAEYADDWMKGLNPLQKAAYHNQYLLTQKSAYTYHDGDRYALTGSSDLTTSYGVIESRLMQGEIAASDFFIAYAVTMAGASDLEMIITYMNWMHRLYPDKVIPYNLSTTSLRSRLDKLSKAGVIRSFNIISNDKKKGLFYGVSELGAKAIRRRLDVNFLSYDTWPLVDCEQRVWRRLTANRLGAALMYLNKKEPPKFYTELYDKNEGVKVPVYVRQTCRYKDKEGKDCKAFLLVEPVSYAVDKHIKTEEELVKDENKRIRTLLSRIDVALGKGVQTRNVAEVCDTALLLFVVDDMAGLRKTAEIIYRISAVALENCLFTTERIIAGNNGKLNRCFFSAKATENEDGKISIKLHFEPKYKHIFGEDNFNDTSLTEEEVVALGMAKKTSAEKN